SVPASEARPSEPIRDLVYLADPLSAPDSKLVVLRGGQLSVRKWLDVAPWSELPTTDADTGKPIVFEAIVPVLAEVGGSLTTGTNFGLIGISDQKRLYAVSLSGACTDLKVSDVDVEQPGDRERGRPVPPRPVAVLRDEDLFIAFMRVADPSPVLFHL